MNNSASRLAHFLIFLPIFIRLFNNEKEKIYDTITDRYTRVTTTNPFQLRMRAMYKALTTYLLVYVGDKDHDYINFVKCAKYFCSKLAPIIGNVAISRALDICGFYLDRTIIGVNKQGVLDCLLYKNYTGNYFRPKYGFFGLINIDPRIYGDVLEKVTYLQTYLNLMNSNPPKELLDLYSSGLCVPLSKSKNMYVGLHFLPRVPKNTSFIKPSKKHTTHQKALNSYRQQMFLENALSTVCLTLLNTPFFIINTSVYTVGPNFVEKLEYIDEEKGIAQKVQKFRKLNFHIQEVLDSYFTPYVSSTSTLPALWGGNRFFTEATDEEAIKKMRNLLAEVMSAKCLLAYRITSLTDADNKKVNPVAVEHLIFVLTFFPTTEEGLQELVSNIRQLIIDDAYVL
jgi:hypothetical protein